MRVSPDDSTGASAEAVTSQAEMMHWRAQNSGSVADLTGARNAAEEESAGDRFTYSHDEFSPDGLFHICYGYTRRGHAALVIEPLISLSATGEILVNLWRSGLTGWAESFTPDGFRLIISDPYGTSHLEVVIDAKHRRFLCPNGRENFRPLHELRATLLRHVADTRRNSAAYQETLNRTGDAGQASAQPEAPATQEVQRLLRSLNGTSPETPTKVSSEPQPSHLRTSKS